MKYWTLTKRMSPKRMLWLFVCGTLLMCMITLRNLRTNSVALTPLKQDLDIKGDREELMTGLQILEPSQFANQWDVKCVNATFEALHFPMCIYDTKVRDTVISKMVSNGKYYEPDLVRKWIDFLRMHPMSFLDLGANLGTYTLPIAHFGFHVVSVEANNETVRRLAKSVHLGRIENNVDLLHYALSNEEDSTTFLQSSDYNPGDTFMVSDASCPGCLSANVTVLNKLIPFIRGKQAVIKIDVQEAEIEIFQRKSAARFFEEIDVVMIQMEWHLYAKRFGRTEDKRRSVDRFLEFFYQRGYDVYDPRTEKKLNAEWRNWTFDVLFKKEDLPKNQLFLI